MNRRAKNCGKNRDKTPLGNAEANAALEYKTWQSSNRWFCARCNPAGEGSGNSVPRRSLALRLLSRKPRTGGVRAELGQMRRHRECLAKPRIESGPSNPAVGG